ncbi:unnamed protein product [Prunus armeniaca]|uniref:Reverse transcriptase Ty1/copia-type domain-containing protein n=1 Tax=Prunus armeniaca TaxID=36596 RepID=A0A6J5XF18_PRUAR|nr:unnamed protein product [Prunus armeniaca]CAB4309478.1 unnamed protein product [Prunus armeniaca]
MAVAESEIELTCYTQASKSPYWQHAILNQFNALLEQRTWSLIPSSSHQNIVSCKWIFKIKRFKACPIAKGFHQQSEINYFDTFSLVVKLTTILTIMSIAISCG